MVDGPDGTKPPPVAQPEAAKPTVSPNPASTTQATIAAASLEDTERSALTYTDFDMDVRLRPAESHLAVRALITVRNDGKTALAHLPLQLSSTLTWEVIRIHGQQVPFAVTTLNFRCRPHRPAS